MWIFYSLIIQLKSHIILSASHPYILTACCIYPITPFALKQQHHGPAHLSCCTKITHHKFRRPTSRTQNTSSTQLFAWRPFYKQNKCSHPLYTLEPLGSYPPKYTHTQTLIHELDPRHQKPSKRLRNEISTSGRIVGVAQQKSGPELHRWVYMYMHGVVRTSPKTPPTLI